jgi:phosphoenolpyruvate carboxykinase (ATP)
MTSAGTPSQYGLEHHGIENVEHGVTVSLVNTGVDRRTVWLRQSHGHRVQRAMVRAALDGALNDVPTRADPNFGVAVPVACPDVPSKILDARTTWPDPDAYDAQARKLAAMFIENFRMFANEVSDEVRNAGPRAA